MIAALRYEWVRLRTIRSTYWVIGLALVLQTIIALLLAWGLDEPERLVSDRSIFEIMATAGAATGGPPLLVAYLLGTLGVFTFGHEYRYGTARATLTALSSRPAVFGAKLTVIGLVVAAVAAVSVLIGAVVQGLAGLGQVPWGSGVGEMVVAVVVYTVLFTWSGLGLAVLLRNQTAAMLILLFVPTVFEFIVRFVVVIIKSFSDDPTDQGGIAVILKYLPYDAGGQLYTRLDFVGGPADFFGPEPFGPVGGGLYFGGFVALVLALGLWRFLRSDA